MYLKNNNLNKLKTIVESKLVHLLAFINEGNIEQEF